MFSFFPFLLSANLSTIWFVIIKKIIPNTKPTAAGNQFIIPCSSASFADGIISDHMLAAIITPAANPTINFCTFLFKFFFKNNTKLLPKLVPINGINMPIILYNISFNLSSSSHYIVCNL